MAGLLRMCLLWQHRLWTLCFTPSSHLEPWLASWSSHTTLGPPTSWTRLQQREANSFASGSPSACFIGGKLKKKTIGGKLLEVSHGPSLLCPQRRPPPATAPPLPLTFPALILVFPPERIRFYSLLSSLPSTPAARIRLCKQQMQLFAALNK